MDYVKYKTDCLDKLKGFLTLEKKRPVLFIGSGLSQRYLKIPDWKGLLDTLCKSPVKMPRPLKYYLQSTNGDYPKVADKLKQKYEQSKAMADKLESNYYRSINGKPFKYSKLGNNEL